MEITLQGYVLAPDETLIIEVTPYAPSVKLSDFSWRVEPEIDAMYKISVKSVVDMVFPPEVAVFKRISINELLLKHNNMTLLDRASEKEEILQADIRAITSAAAIADFEEAGRLIALARSLWII